MDKLAYFDDENTNPGLILAAKKPPAGLYWQAVRHIVEKESHLKAALLSGNDPKAGLQYHKGWKNGRGLIGSISATSWHPRDSTFELIAYRQKKTWGTPRKIDRDRKSVV